MKITFEPAIDLEGHPMTLTVILNDGHGLRATLHDLTDAGVPALFRAVARATERHLKGDPEVIIGPAVLWQVRPGSHYWPGGSAISAVGEADVNAKIN